MTSGIAVHFITPVPRSPTLAFHGHIFDSNGKISVATASLSFDFGSDESYTDTHTKTRDAFPIEAGL